MQHFDVKGMSCQHCVNAITAAIQHADAHATVDVDLAAGKVLVSGATVPAAILLEAIAEEGYEATQT